MNDDFNLNDILFYKGFLLLFISLFITFFITSKYFKKINIGKDIYNEKRKVHSWHAYRLGFLPIIIPLILSLSFMNYNSPFLKFILISCIPLFIVTIYEDITLKGRILPRLLSTILAVFLLIAFSGHYLKDVDITWLNNLLSIKSIGIIITIFGISATVNAWNFIDGLNGLSSGMGIIVISSFTILAHKYNIIPHVDYLLPLVLVIFGFWIINIFSGKIFLGDTGAYFIGIIIGWTGVTLTNLSDRISAWTIFLIIIYPATELTLTFIRRIISGNSPFKPDDRHFHSLFYTTLNLTFKKQSPFLINSLSGLIILTLGFLPSVFSIIYSDNYKTTQVLIIIFICLFILLNYAISIYLKRINTE